MSQSFAGINGLLLTIVLATLAVGLPIVFVLMIRFLWERSLTLGRSKELEKLIWQLHRIASAMEHQMNLSFPAVQPGTEEARDLAYLQPVAVNPAAAASAPSASATAAVAAPAPVAQRASAPQAVPAAPVAQAAPAASPVAATTATPAAAPVAQESDELPPLAVREPGKQAPRGGVNSMFGL